MKASTRFTAKVALIVALGGFLMGFDASVISGVVGFIETEFRLTKIQLGWSVSSLALTATFAMMVAGPLSDRIGRRPVLKIAALLFAVSAVASALAPSFLALVIARRRHRGAAGLERGFGPVRLTAAGTRCTGFRRRTR